MVQDGGAVAGPSRRESMVRGGSRMSGAGGGGGVPNGGMPPLANNGQYGRQGETARVRFGQEANDDDFEEVQVRDVSDEILLD